MLLDKKLWTTPATLVHPLCLATFLVMGRLQTECSDSVILQMSPLTPSICSFIILLNFKKWLGLEGALKTFWFKLPPPLARSLPLYFGLLNSQSSLALSTSKDRSSTISLENLFQITILTMKNFFPMFKLNLHSLSVNPVPLFSSYKPL